MADAVVNEPSSGTKKHPRYKGASWKYHPEFKETYLDILWDKGKKLFNEAHKACDGVGNDMIVWMSINQPETHKEICSLASQEVGDNIVAERLGEVDYDLGKRSSGRFVCD